MAEKLTPQQRQAVIDRGGKLLVSAAAGSGKTKVLVDRLLRYLTDPAAPAELDEFLIITYTKAAAMELRGKIAAKLTQAIAQDPENKHLQRQMQRLFLTKISTVHGFCADVLREYAYRLDIPGDFRVADENECRELRETVLADVLDEAYGSAREDGDFRAFVDTQGLGRDDRLVSEIVLKVYDSARCHMDPEKWLDDCLGAVSLEGVTDAGQTVWGHYLMEELFAFLDSHLAVMRRVVALAEEAGNLGKATVNLRDMLLQMEHLRQSETWDDVVRRKQLRLERLNFPRKNVDAELVDQLRACRKKTKEALEKKARIFADPSGQVLLDLSQSAAGTRGLIGLVRRFDKAYQKAKKSRRCLDFGDLEHRTLDLLLGKYRGTPTATAEEIGRRFREIMVDEYQDSNQVQDSIFEALTCRGGNCFMVGDVKQSIYQFRLADPSIFLEKYQAYAHAADAAPGQGRKVMLSANFRSGGEIIEAVNDVFRDCMSPRVGGLEYGPEEALREGIPHVQLPDAAVELYGIEVEADTYAEEAAFTARRISQMLREGTAIRDGESLRPVREEDIVILLRSPGSSAMAFQQALEGCGIRCATGAGQDLLQTGEIMTLRSILQTVANPRQDIPLISAMASPVFGFTADDLAAIRGNHRGGSFYDALLADDGAMAAAFRETLEMLRQEARMNTVTELIRKIFTETRMESIYGALADGEQRVSNLRLFYKVAAEYEATSRRDLGQFLDYLTTMEEKGLVTAAGENAGCVSIMSIHKSKGLEFPVVFLCGLSREFNRESLRAQVLCDKALGLGMSVADTVNRLRYPAISKRAIAAKTGAESLSEELRVLYVAMTRARDRLVMTYASKYLRTHLSNIAMRVGIGGKELLSREAVCPGEWVLLSAMGRTEAGALHALGGRPPQTRMGQYPWKIAVVQGPEAIAAEAVRQDARQDLSEDALRQLQAGLAYRYPYPEATRSPSKQTATQQKGRFKDQEAAEDTREPERIFRSWRKPSFISPVADGVTYGNAMHKAMQYIRFDGCGSTEEVDTQIRDLVRRKLLTPEQGEMVSREHIAAFFRTDLGKRLCSGGECLREFKFSILDDGSHYGSGLENERVLLQGVVDCALLEEDGITVVDFKTDHITPENRQALILRYRDQVRIYAHAMGQIYQKNVKGSYLYFFQSQEFVPIGE